MRNVPVLRLMTNSQVPRGTIADIEAGQLSAVWGDPSNAMETINSLD